MREYGDIWQKAVWPLSVLSKLRSITEDETAEDWGDVL